MKNHPVTGNWLLALGSLLYTWSVFLIAQIYSTSTSFQGTAILLLLSWIGVLSIAYLLRSPASLVIAMIEVLLWLLFQYLVFSLPGREPSFGMLALLFLFAGLLFYGANIWHKAQNLMFSSIYQFWTVFYILLFTYLLSFQALLPLLWSNQAGIAPRGIAFLSSIGILAAVILFSGILFNKKRILRTELLGIAALTLLLLGMIFLASFTADSLGYCSQKPCEELDSSDCESASNCMWYSNECKWKGCFSFQNQSSCRSAEIDCVWEKDFCREQGCFDLKSIDACNRNERCSWDAQSASCIEKSCWNLPKWECESPCVWKGQQCLDNRSIDACSDYTNDHEACVVQQGCAWHPSGMARVYGESPRISAHVWIIWLVINIFFVAIILGVIAYGMMQKDSAIINIGIAFFGLDVITRYIGFLIDFWGYVHLSIMFIIGGTLLILGGFFMERWRRRLIRKAAK